MRRRLAASYFPASTYAIDFLPGEAMTAPLATRLFGAEAHSVAGSGRLRPKSACLKPVLGLSLRTCPAQRAPQGSRSEAQAAKVKRRRRLGHGIAREVKNE